MNIFPKFSGAALTDDKSILDALRGSDLVRKAAAERDTHVLKFRKTAADRLAKIEADAEITFPKLRAAREATIAAAREAELKWRAALTVAQQAQIELGSASHTFSTEQLKLEAQLAETASPEIAIFITDMRDLWHDCLKKFAFHNHTETANRATGHKVVINSNNKASVVARQQAIDAAKDAAEAMRLEPDQSSVPARLQEIRNNLPAITSL